MRAILAAALYCAALTGPALAADAFHQLDIGLVAFDPGIPPESQAQKPQGVFPDVRRAEASYLPFVLRQTLVQSDHWGVVRVLPESDPSAELLISAVILRSDGMALEVALKAIDCTGREWLNKTYQATTSEQDFSNARDRSKPLFARLFREIEFDLHNRANEVGAAEIERIEQVSQLLYAAALVPEAFAGYLTKNALGLWELQRLPASNDPLMARVERVREHEFLFVDTVDEQYAELYNNMTPSYDLWRKLLREQVAYEGSHTEYLQTRQKRRLDAYESMQQTYNAYKWAKNEQLEMKLLASGLNNEIAPTLLQIEDRLISLDGSLQERYQELRGILLRMFLQETGSDGTTLP